MDSFLREVTILNTPRSSRSKSIDTKKSYTDSPLNNIIKRDTLNFNIFLSAVEFLSTKTFPEMEPQAAFALVVQKHLLPLLEEKKMDEQKLIKRSYFKKLIEILGEPSIVKNPTHCI